jgi:hypothetical protein
MNGKMQANLRFAPYAPLMRCRHPVISDRLASRGMLFFEPKPNLTHNVRTTSYGDVSRAIYRRPPARPRPTGPSASRKVPWGDIADQLAPPQVDKTHEILKAFVAPVAHQSDAVTKDPRALVTAQSVYAALAITVPPVASPGVRSLLPAQAPSPKRYSRVGLTCSSPWASCTGTRTRRTRCTTQ